MIDTYIYMDHYPWVRKYSIQRRDKYLPASWGDDARKRCSKCAIPMCSECGCPWAGVFAGCAQL